MKDDFPEQDGLWNLLGKARSYEASPFFARNVLREIRQSTPHPKSAWALPRWLTPTAFAVIVLGFIFSFSYPSPNYPSAPMSPELAEYFDEAALLHQITPAVDFTPAHLAGL